MTVALDSALEVHPRVALRPEPFGALAYHGVNRRLVLMKHVDVVSVVMALADHPDVESTLQACGVAPHRWPSFLTALTSLEHSEVVRERNHPH